MGNSDFKEKKERYLKSRMDAFKVSKVFIENSDVWNVEVLKKRQERNIKMIVENKYV